MANVLATFAQFERRLIGQRTKEALAEKRRRGVKLGRRPELPQKVARRIKRERSRGDSLRSIAAGLNADRVPTAHGGKQWWAETIRGVLARN
jgi:DNA invertase Pin-like site-specific DNA recombinase